MDPATAYHWIRANDEIEPRTTGGEPLEDLDCQRGALLDLAAGSPLSFEVDVSPSRAAPPHFLGQRLPLVSDRFIAAIAAAGVDNFQAFPAHIRCPRQGTEWPGYSLFNVIGLLDAVDRDSSVGESLMDEEAGPELIEFEKLVLARDKTIGLDMFRLWSNPAMLLVHDRVRQTLARYVPDEGWGIVSEEIELR